jgi:hypothetical protein
MLSVAARARSARLQALTTRWLDPTATRSREHVFGAALTLAVRTALAPNGLGTALHTIQNTYRRTKDAPSFTPALDTTRSVVHAKLVIPRTRSLTRFAATLRQEHLGPVRAMPSQTVPFGRRASPTKDTSGRRLQSHMSKTSTRCLARLPSRLPELPLVRCDECCGSRRRHSLRPALPPVQRTFSARRSSGAPSPLMPPSPPELRWLIRPTRPGRPRPFPPPQCVNGDSFHSPEHLPLERSPSRALCWFPTLGRAEHRVQLTPPLRSTWLLATTS